jgi:S-adenosylmethionine-dependent methyltransferase
MLGQGGEQPAWKPPARQLRTLGGCKQRGEISEGKLMSATADEFGQVLHKWQKENAMPWGRLRYHSAWRNIAKHVEDRPLRILDIGGGDGMDAIHYASLGHRVTLSDCSPTMLSEAKASAQEQGVTERLRFVQTSPEAVPDLFHEQPFDLILCHMMIEFVPDAQSFLRDACQLLSSGGLFSVLDTNRYSDVYMQAFQVKNLAGALDAVGAREYFHPWVNRLTPRFAADEVIDQFTENNCSLVGHYGVLSVCAYLPNEPKFDPQYYSELAKLENRLADQYPYYLLARFFQVIAQKN